MKIIIDATPLKTESIRRGVGKYTRSLLRFIIKNGSEHSFYLFNLPKEYVHEFSFNNVLFDTKTPSEDFINKFDFFLITSLFECTEKLNLNIDIITCKKGLIFFDLIPVLFWEEYIDKLTDKMKEEYFERLQLVSVFDIIFSISETTKNDLINILEIPGSRIQTIYAGIEESFFNWPKSQKSFNTLKKKFNIFQPYIMSTPGIDFRKNILGIIEGYANLPRQSQEKYQMIIVCHIPREIQRNLMELWLSLGLKKEKLILTDYISQEELITLYDYAEVFLFPSLYEGFGLPLAEAMSRGCPVITAKNSSLIEVCESSAIYIDDPLDYQNIGDMLFEVLSNKVLMKKMSELGKNQALKFNWDKVSLFFLKKVEELLINDTIMREEKKYKIAFFGPLKPQNTGIADYSENLISYLENYYQIDFFIDDGYIPANEQLIRQNRIFHHKKFSLMVEDYDCIMYQLGNSTFHTYMLEYMLNYPGLLVIHDCTIHGLLYYLYTQNKTLKSKYLCEVFENYGYLDYKKFKDTIESGLHPDLYDLNYNFLKKYIDKNYVTLVNSDYMKTILEKQITFADIRVVPFSFPEKQRTGNRTICADDIQGQFIISSFGRITKTKRIDVVLKAFSQLLKRNPNLNIQLLLVGEIFDDVHEEIFSLIINEKLEDHIVCTGFIEETDFDKYYDMTDICINLRYPSTGGMSATFLKSLMKGIPTIVTNIPPYSDFPDDCVVKVNVNNDEAEYIADVIEKLINNVAFREKMKYNITNYIEKNFSIERVLEIYRQAIHDVIRYNKIIVRKKERVVIHNNHE